MASDDDAGDIVQVYHPEQQLFDLTNFFNCLEHADVSFCNHFLALTVKLEACLHYDTMLVCEVSYSG